jgi:hypothetical protein
MYSLSAYSIPLETARAMKVGRLWVVEIRLRIMWLVDIEK